MELMLLNQEKKTGKVSLLMKDTTPAVVNTLRRLIVNEVPTMAIDLVELKKNSTVLYDEMVAHRLGLVPLKTDLKSYELPEKCSCNKEGCAKCRLLLSLKTKGSGYVYAERLESTDPKVVPVHEKMPIAKLIKGQQLEVDAVATLGRGRDHMKWSPGVVWFTHQSQVTVNNNSPKLDEVKDKYPPQIFNKAGKIDKNMILDLNLVDACDGVCDDVVKVEYQPNNFIFHIEPFGQLSSKEMLLTAVAVMEEKIEAMEKLIEQ